MKSYVFYLQGLYKSLLSEVIEYYPTDRVNSERDASRLLSLVESRGLSFLMIDLPDMGKHFDQCLAHGRLTQSGIAGQRPFKTGSPIPRLFKGLVLRVFDESGLLRVVPDVIAIRFLRQLYYAAKKVKVSCDDSKTWEHVNEFYRTDLEVESPSLNWDEDQLRVDHLGSINFLDSLSDLPLLPLFPDLDQVEGGSRSSFSSELLDRTQRVCDIISAELGEFRPSEWRTKHGPGAVADQRRTQFKYDFPSWPAKLDGFFPYDEFAFANSSCWVDSITSGEYIHSSLNEYPSKLIAVPKTLKGPRLIASEPVSHQWCQQSIKDFLAGRLRDTALAASIHFRDQSWNQNLAREASHAQSHATIDLSSASDRLSLYVVERMFRRNPSLILAMHASRTRWVVNTIDRKSPKFHKLRKFACMGSACTFPVQSYVFACLAIASVLHCRRLAVTIHNIRKVSREVQVFGDDIIIPLDCSGTLQGLLSHLRLKVNRQKTFETGKFRESCGLDAYDGTDVTPTYSMTYPDQSRPESIASVIETHNNFVRRGYYRVAAYIRATLRKLRRFVLPFVADGSGQFGLLAHFGETNRHLQSRWNERLHCREYLVDTVRTASKRWLPTGVSVLLQYFTEGLTDSFIEGDRLGVVRETSTSIRRRWVNANFFSA